MAFDINTDALVKLTTKLGGLHKSALPSAVRNTLNDAAFETKTWIPITASRKFTTRKKSFFRAFSSVEKARGFDINGMKSAAGINPAKGSQVADGLEGQETGGTINTRKLIPHDKARIGGSHSRVLKRKHRLDRISLTTPGRKTSGGVNYLLVKKGNKGTVFEVGGAGKKNKLTPIYTYKNSKKSKVKKAPFMAPAAMIATKQIPNNYLKNATFQINKIR